MRLPTSFFGTVLLVVLATTPASPRTFAAETKPATVAEATRNLNLETFPIMPGVEEPPEASLARLAYHTKEPTPAAYAFQKKELGKLGWKELPGSMVTDQYATGIFQKQQYLLSVMVIPDDKLSSVMLMQHGNVDLTKIPVPPGTKVQYAGPTNLLLVTDAPKEETQAAVRKLLEAAKWEPYGGAADTLAFRQNAVLLNATVSAAPALDNKTMISLATELMSVELPLPRNAQEAQYSDSTTALSFDSPDSIDAVGKFYQDALAPAGWKATSEKPMKVDFRYSLIFRNPAKDLIELTLHKSDLGTRTLVAHQTAVRVAELEAKAKAAIAKQNAAKNAPKAQVSITIPADAKDAKTTKTQSEFNLASGKAKALAAEWLKAFEKDGWKSTVAVTEKEAGSLTLTKGDVTLSVTYIDPGFIPAQVTVSVIGGELDVTTKK